MGFDLEKVQFSPAELAVGADLQVVIEAVKDGVGPEDIHAIDEVRAVVEYIVGAGGEIPEIVERLLALASMLSRNNLDEFFPDEDTPTE